MGAHDDDNDDFAATRPALARPGATSPPSAIGGAIPRTTTPFPERLERSDFALPRPVRVQVKEGETLADVADEYGVSITSLLRANPQVRDPERVFAGEELRLPAHGRLSATPSPAGTKPPASSTSPGFRAVRSTEDDREARARAMHDESRAWATSSKTRLDSEPPRLEDVVDGDARFHVPHEGPVIRQLQARFNGAGFRVPETGRFGSTMRLAVKELQRRHDLTETGAIGAKTLEALGASELHAIRDGQHTLHAHDEGGAVRHVQRLLGVALTDVLDATTEDAVRDFQAVRGLREDGVVDFRTLAALEGASNQAARGNAPGQQAAAPRLDQHALSTTLSTMPPATTSTTTRALPDTRTTTLGAFAAALMVRAQQGRPATIGVDAFAADDALGHTGRHVSGPALAAHLSSHAVPSRFVDDAELEDLVVALQQGRAVPVSVETFGGTVIALDGKSTRYPGLRTGDLYARRFGVDHWVVVTGFRGDPANPTAIVANDSDSGATVELSRREFERHAVLPGGMKLVLPA
jgi:peptidoglycan hydrolase-like protein with peptidoglycan-binding domain